MANIANITLAILLAAQMAGAMVQRQGIIHGVDAAITATNN